jgi:hypothetical protein
VRAHAAGVLQKCRLLLRRQRASLHGEAPRKKRPAHLLCPAVLRGVHVREAA